MIPATMAQWALTIWGACFGVVLTVYLVIRALESMEVLVVQPSVAAQPVRRFVLEAFLAGGEAAVLWLLWVLALQWAGVTP